MEMSIVPKCMSESNEQTTVGNDKPPDTAQELSITIDLGKLHTLYYDLYLQLRSIPECVMYYLNLREHHFS